MTWPVHGISCGMAVPVVSIFIMCAVVTGSSCGIGKAYAVELARRGMNIVLLSREEKKLIKTAQELGWSLINYSPVNVLLLIMFFVVVGLFK